ncbi:MAG: radical SAM protein [Candidatus Aminicenantes bacterium]|nr:radical SAM protein [Candidatus Aminicenantes bacterium]
MFGGRSFKWEQLKRAVTSIPRDFFTSNLLTHFTVLPPSVLVYNVTFRCNMKCRMCLNWTKKEQRELTVSELEKVLKKGGLFHRIENVSISGGEPTLRADLPEIVEVLYNNLPRVRKMSIVTNALNTHRVVGQVKAIARLTMERNSLLSIGVSLDGMGEIHDRIRNVPRAYERVRETIHALMELRESVPFSLGMGTVVIPDNFSELNKMVEFCQQNNIDLSFSILRFSDSILGNETLQSDLVYNEEQRAFIGKFFHQLLQKSSFIDGDSYLYMHWSRMLLDNSQRTMPCPFMDQGIQLNPEGELYYCEMSKPIGNVLQEPAKAIYYKPENLAYRRKLIARKCSACISPCQTLVSVRKKLYPYAGFVFYLSGLKIARLLGIIRE